MHEHVRYNAYVSITHKTYGKSNSYVSFTPPTNYIPPMHILSSIGPLPLTHKGLEKGKK